MDSAVLSDKQEAVLREVQEGKNVFFTGSAGVGKSFLLRRCVQALQEKHGAQRVGVSASTGIAATHIMGTTVHSLFGCGLVQKVKDFDRMKKPSNADRLRQLRAVVIDEISMVSGEMFEHLERMVSTIRGGTKPFGGLQLVICGDFFQLPPVPNKGMDAVQGPFRNLGFAFQAPAWKRCRLHTFVLTEVFRQKDKDFVSILNDVRKGKADTAVASLKDTCMRPLNEDNGIKPTVLYPFNRDVDEVNNRELHNLSGEEVVSVATDSTHVLNYRKMSLVDTREAEAKLKKDSFWRDCLSTEIINLKVGAQVMLLKNLDLTSKEAMLVNGSRGVVIDFVDKENVTKELKASASSFKENMGRHPSSGMDLEDVMVKISVLNKISLDRLPVVKFINGRVETIFPFEFSREIPLVGKCMRLQLPLKLAWALTIHKCQGLTLDKCRVSLSGVFAEGQAYVALSRARTLEGLEITSISDACVKVSPVVASFYGTLSRGEEYADTFLSHLDGCTQEQKENSPPNPVGKHMQSELGSKRKASAWAMASQGGRTGVKCYRCSGFGHWAAGCPRSQSAIQARTMGDMFSTPPGPSTGHAPPQGGKGGCFRCGAQDHWAKECPTKSGR